MKKCSVPGFLWYGLFLRGIWIFVSIGIGIFISVFIFPQYNAYNEPYPLVLHVFVGIMLGLLLWAGGMLVSIVFIHSYESYIEECRYNEEVMRRYNEEVQRQIDSVTKK